MSKSEIPLSVDAVKPFEQGSERNGNVPIAMFGRLTPLLAESSGEVSARLAFSFDDEKRRVIEGALSATLQVECQRCLEPMPLTVESEFRIGVVDSEALAEQLPAELEPVVTSGRDLDVQGVIEDELIMSLPAFPLHENDQCRAAETLERINASADEQFEHARKERDNPFQVLAELGKSDSGGQESDQ